MKLRIIFCYLITTFISTNAWALAMPNIFIPTNNITHAKQLSIYRHYYQASLAKRSLYTSRRCNFVVITCAGGIGVDYFKGTIILHNLVASGRDAAICKLSDIFTSDYAQHLCNTHYRYACGKDLCHVIGIQLTEY